MRTTEEIKLLSELGDNVRKLRLSRNFSQTEFANCIGKDQPSLNRLENGKINPGYLYLQQIASGLGVHIVELFEKNN